MLEPEWSHESTDAIKGGRSKEMARYRRAIQGSNQGYWEWDLRRNQILCYGAFWKKLGYRIREVHPVIDSSTAIDYIHPADKPAVEEAICKTINALQPYNLYYRLRCKNGEYLWVQGSAKGFCDERGEVAFISGTHTNISQLKKTEQELLDSQRRYDRIIEGTNDGVWEWNIKTNEIEYSDVCWEQLGYSVEDIRQANFNNIADWTKRMSPDDVEIYRNELSAHIIQRTPFDLEYEMQAKNGERVWIRSRAQATYDENGKAAIVSGSNMNITELKRTQSALILARDRAERASQAKSEFLSNMSHELRTPLNAILGYAQLLGFDKRADREQQEHISEIRKAGNHLLQLINDILDLAQVEAGKLHLVIEPVETGRIIDDCYTLMQPIAAKRNITLLKDARPCDQLVVFADSTRLKQSIINLLNNAVKYNRESGLVRISVSRQSETHMRICVVDTGMGIPDNKKHEVYEAFNRLNLENMVCEGSGVGLAVTKKLIELMKGKIGFTSKLGEGSTFWLDLPIANVEHEVPLIKEKPYNAAKRPKITFCGFRRILYIEDNIVNIDLLSKLTQRCGHIELITAMDPMTGLYKARTEAPEIILLDINLPSINGYDVLKVLQQDEATCSIPVVALSANAMPFEIKKGLKAGFNDYLTKPIDYSHFVEVLNRNFKKIDTKSDN